MRQLKSVTLLVFICFATHIVDAAFAQRLPEGAYHPIRERTVDIIHYKAELQLDLVNSRVFGESTISFSPLGKIKNLSLDAICLNVDEVKLMGTSSSKELNFRLEDNSLLIELGQSYTPMETLAVAVRYSCQPNAGMYFQQDRAHKGQYFVHTYGEGGLHANWLPIYNDVNDKFPTEMVITVPEFYTVISNGKLLGVSKAAKGQQSFHWKQTLPHSNYLISIYAGLFEKGELPSAFGSIPLSYWVPKGRLQEGKYAFRNTTSMVEFFSRRFNYTYPWDKYDQIAIPDYAIGAMEHTGVTGHLSSVLREASAPLDFTPNFNNYHSFWTAEGTISHELAHHWFGDNLTCRNLSYIWLNESFASYCQMLWDEEAFGKKTLLFDRQIAFDRYLEYVAKEHTIRPLQYHYFDTPDEIYNEEHTYLKGAIVLHMLRSILGDDNFFGAISYYLKKNEYKNVESNDLKIAIGESTGKNLDWFFDDWVYGGGHPVFEVSDTYFPNHKVLELNVKQVQAMVQGQDLFKLPVTITIATADGIAKQKIWIEKDEETFLFESATRPLMVSFDGAGELVAELQFDKKVEELLYQIRHDELPGQIWALRQLAERFPTRDETLNVISEILAGDGFWGLKAEAALQLGSLRTAAAWQLLTSVLENPEYRIRKAAVLASPHFSSSLAKEKLMHVINTDSHSDVVATAIVALAKTDPDVEVDFIRKQIGRPSWYSEITTACVNTFGILGRESLVSEILPFTTEEHNQNLRMAALKAWESCVPEDSELHKTLMMSAEKAPYQLQKLAIEMLGSLHVTQAKQLLEKTVRESGDVNITVLAEHALNQINRIENFNR